MQNVLTINFLYLKYCDKCLFIKCNSFFSVFFLFLLLFFLKKKFVSIEKTNSLNGIKVAD